MVRKSWSPRENASDAEPASKYVLQMRFSLPEDGLRIDREKCIKCFQCAEHCFAGAKYLVGQEYEIEELYKQIEKDKIFYSIMGGGVTFSGGEPLTHPRYLAEIAKTCRQKGIDVAIESCGAGIRRVQGSCFLI